MVTTISPEQLAQIRERDREVVLIDVRTPVEFREMHVDFARNIPLEQLSIAAEEFAAEEPVYVICHSGSRGSQACQKLKAAGVTAINVEGGTLAWSAAGLPVMRGPKSISLERQVRIAAGSLVLTGVILALTVHPYFAALAGFVGAGLVLSGITDTCGMGLLLARMPWNRVAEASTPAAKCHANSCGASRV
jgi:rhodanese-related sulfurtransferase